MGSKILALKRAWVRQGFHATYFSYARGVTILLSKSLPCLVEQVFLDPGGRYVILILEMYAQRWAMVNVYIPPSFDPTVLYTIFMKLAPLQVYKIIEGGTLMPF